MSEAEEPVAAPAVRPGGSGTIAAAFEAFCRAFLRRYCALEVTAAAALPQGPMVLVSNHRSHLDSVALMVAAGLPFGRCALLAAEDYFFRTPWRLALLSRVLRLIPIRRRASARAFRDTLARSRAFLAAGGAALIAYPEGTRNTAPAWPPSGAGRWCWRCRSACRWCRRSSRARSACSPRVAGCPAAAASRCASERRSRPRRRRRNPP